MVKGNRRAKKDARLHQNETGTPYSVSRRQTSNNPGELVPEPIAQRLLIAGAEPIYKGQRHLFGIVGPIASGKSWTIATMIRDMTRDSENDPTILLALRNGHRKPGYLDYFERLENLGDRGTILFLDDLIPVDDTHDSIDRVHMALDAMIAPEKEIIVILDSLDDTGIDRSSGDSERSGTSVTMERGDRKSGMRLGIRERTLELLTTPREHVQFVYSTGRTRRRPDEYFRGVETPFDLKGLADLPGSIFAATHDPRNRF